MSGNPGEENAFPRASLADTHKPLAESYDAIIVGGGPGGSATAIAMAQRGLHVLMIEKDEYPREKVCGDGLTPRSVRMLRRLKVDTQDWAKQRGLRVYAGKVQGLELLWPDLREIPSYSLVARRDEFDDVLAGHAVAAGAQVLTGAKVDSLLSVPEADELCSGVVLADGREARAKVVVLAEGNTSRLANKAGFERIESRPMGVAVRAYYRTTREPQDFMESWLELWDGVPGESNLLPGYGWLFDLGDGTVNIGLGMLSTSKGFGKTDYREQLRKWVASMPEEWGISEESRISPIRGAALPMAHHRRLSRGGLIIVGDAAGMVSPFNGEGISYAMEAGEFAAEAVAEAYRRGIDTAYGMAALAGYEKTVKQAWGGYFRLGTIFTRLIGIPQVMAICTRYGLPRKRLMKLVHKLLAQLVDTKGGNFDDHLITMASKVAPSV